MCGIFGFALKTPTALPKVYRVLEKLEVHQYLQEPRPVGGYGAGIAILNDEGTILLEKVGKGNSSPARQLSEIVKGTTASVLIGHVRMPSPEFMETARFKETAQPYVVRCHADLNVVSAHNGKVENYQKIRRKLGSVHTFESEKVELVDSEVIPHLFEELLERKVKAADALDAFLKSLDGSNTIVLLQIGTKGRYLHFIHKGKTRGLAVWTNEQGEVVFCSRKEPLISEFGSLLANGKFEEKVSILYGQETNLKLSFNLKI